MQCNSGVRALVVGEEGKTDSGTYEAERGEGEVGNLEGDDIG